MKQLIPLIVLIGFFHGMGNAQEKSDTGSQNVQDTLTESSSQPKDFPLIFRRTTLIVRNIKKSLALYKDAMGMKVIYDKNLTRPHPTEDQDQIVRLVFLKATADFTGVLGLMEYDYENPNKKIKPIRKEGFTAQNTVLLFNSKDQEARLAAVKKLSSIEMIKDPPLVEYQLCDGKEPIKEIVPTFYDPDGNIVEFNKLLTEL